MRKFKSESLHLYDTFIEVDEVFEVDGVKYECVATGNICRFCAFNETGKEVGKLCLNFLCGSARGDDKNVIFVRI